MNAEVHGLHVRLTDVTTRAARVDDTIKELVISAPRHRVTPSSLSLQLHLISLCTHRIQQRCYQPLPRSSIIRPHRGTRPIYMYVWRRPIACCRWSSVDVTWGSGRGCPLVVHYWADLQSVHGLRCYGNTMEMRGRAQR